MRFSLLDLLLPREVKFFNHFEEQVTNLHRGCVIFRDLVQHIDSMSEAAIKETLVQIKECEQHGDAIERGIIDELQRTFITPIDREDIHNMAVAIDKSMDILNSISRKIDMYNVRKAPKNVSRLADVMVESATDLKLLIGALRDKGPIDVLVMKIHNLENKADEIFYLGMAEMFDENTTPHEVIKNKELYEHLEAVVDSIDHIAKTIRGIAVKMG